jgi:hypothetical protein
MGNEVSSPIQENNMDTLTVIKTSGNDAVGISIAYKKEDEAKLISKIQETFNMQTETFEKPKIEVSNVEQDLQSIQEKDEEEEKEEKEEKDNEEDKKIMNKLQDILIAKSETD